MTTDTARKGAPVKDPATTTDEAPGIRLSFELGKERFEKPIVAVSTVPLAEQGTTPPSVVINGQRGRELPSSIEHDIQSMTLVNWSGPIDLPLSIKGPLRMQSCHDVVFTKPVSAHQIRMNECRNVVFMCRPQSRSPITCDLCSGIEACGEAIQTIA